MMSFSNINKQYGKRLIFVDASFQLNPGEKVGLGGPNGAGKTTLFRMVVGGRVRTMARSLFRRRRVAHSSPILAWMLSHSGKSVPNVWYPDYASHSNECVVEHAV
jgi:ABC-type Mn2+/Zn2+ transport system ATPase subunit